MYADSRREPVPRGHLRLGRQGDPVLQGLQLGRHDREHRAPGEEGRPSSASCRPARRASRPRTCSPRSATSSRRTRTCRTPRTPTTGRGSPARRASGSSTCARCSETTTARAPGRAGERRAVPVDRLGCPMAIPKVVGIETEYGISAAGRPGLQPGPVVVDPDQRVRRDRCAGSGGTTSRSRRCATPGASSPCQERAAGRRGPRPRERHPAERRALLRRPRAPRVLDPGVRHAARSGRARQGRGADPGALAARPCSAMLPPGERIADLQEQHRRQGQLLRHATRTTWSTARRRSRDDRPRPDAVLRDAGRSSPAPARSGSESARGSEQRRRRTSSRSGRTSSRPRSGLETTLKRPDHQHPRRAARRPREVPPPARASSATRTCARSPRS